MLPVVKLKPICKIKNEERCLREYRKAQRCKEQPQVWELPQKLLETFNKYFLKQHTAYE